MSPTRSVAVPAATASRKRKAEDDLVTNAPATKRQPSARNAAATAAKKRKADDQDGPESTADATAPAPKRARKTAVAPTTTKKAPATKAKKTPVAKAEAAPKKTITARAKKPAAATKAVDEHEPVVPKKAAAPKKTTAPKKAAAPKAPTLDLPPLRARINDAPTQRFDVYVFGEGGSGELGLGSRAINGKKPIDVKRPRHNAKLAADTVGVVQVACGGMHSIALTADNKILTWGVNDQGALGRDTTWNEDDNKNDDDDDSDDEESGLNPVESTPTEVSAEFFTPGTKFAMVAASDSASFALTEDGFVYGWGTFRASEGILGFSDKVKVQSRPAYLRSLKNITAIAAGSNHMLALDKAGVVVAWGCGQQNQLGRRVIERFKTAGLTPTAVGLPRKKITKIACGSYHSFAVDKDGRAYAWGLNNFGMTGIAQGAGEDEAVILRPTIIDSLKEYRIVDIAGGEHHSVACTDDGRLLAWGRSDGAQTGVPRSRFTEENAIIDENGNPRILSRPEVLPEVTNVHLVAAGTDNSFAITAHGKAYSWGFSANYQTGQGTTDDIPVPTLIDNTAVRGKHLTFAGAGGQFSVLAGPSS